MAIRLSVALSPGFRTDSFRCPHSFATSNQLAAIGASHFAPDSRSGDTLVPRAGPTNATGVSRLLEMKLKAQSPQSSTLASQNAPSHQAIDRPPRPRVGEACRWGDRRMRDNRMLTAKEGPSSKKWPFACLSPSAPGFARIHSVAPIRLPLPINWPRFWSLPFCASFKEWGHSCPPRRSDERDRQIAPRHQAIDRSPRPRVGEACRWVTIECGTTEC